MIAMVVLYLTVSDVDTGQLLYSDRREIITLSEDKMHECLEQGTIRAHLLANQYRRTYPNASANVNCKWEYAARI